MLGGSEALANYYNENFRMIINSESNWSLAELESMLPWERDIYISLQISHNKERQAEIEKANN